MYGVFIKQKPEGIQAHWKTADTCCTSGQLLYGLQVGFLRFESQHSYLLVLVAGAAIDAFDIYFYFLCDGSQTCLRMIQHSVACPDGVAISGVCADPSGL